MDTSVNMKARCVCEKLCLDSNQVLKIDNCKTFMPPFPNIWRIGLTIDLDLWSTALNINRDHLLIKDYPPTKFEASWSIRSWVICCTRCGRLTWPLTLMFDLLTWISIGIIYSPRTIYLLSLKLLGQSVVELSVAQGVGDRLDLDVRPTDLNINRDHLLIKDYLPTKFEASGVKRCWVISCTRLRPRDTDIPTNMCNVICPSFFEGGHKKIFLT